MLVLRGAEGEDACSGVAPGDLRGWVHDFATEYRRLTGRQPVLSTTAQWWATCVGPAGDLGGLDLALRDPADLPGDLPEGWERPVLWLAGEPGGPGDTTYFGTLHELRQWAVSALR
ncbi:hypothetical protein G7070_03435 [Propioniciclava coleopterorum]|uniref:Uncharacterized protein n=1 Tax=Propioniciclava coleopterorum TaxID=2714937 RepID=A0A6G7Y475_9ACTN|nr:hypothetical protein [Propioniciclava coleopterorum]QIK71509.1 hypothetical protein G7070_03435 [Propioniciclava coleopterorum]